MHRRGDGVMKATLLVIENDANHALAKALIEKLMGSTIRQIRRE
jgi:hypothetical protein